jgi:alpha-galactosidase
MPDTLPLTDNPHIACWTETERNDSAAEVRLIAQSDNVLEISLSAPNVALAYVALRWDFAIAPHTQIMGDHWERGYGDLEWRGIVPERVLPWYALLADRKTGVTFGIGVETGAGALSSWRVDEVGVTLMLDVRNGGSGVHSGERLLQAAVVHSLSSESGEDSFAFARRFCRALCPAPRLPSQPVYGGNDWYFRYGNITAETVWSDSALIRELSPNRENAPFYVIDAGWFPGKGCNGGPYEVGNTDFPDLPGLASRMTDNETRPGIWIRPLLTQAAVPVTWRLPETHPHGKARENYLDPSVPEVLELVREDIRRLTLWGYRMIKHDFTTFDITGKWGFQMGSEVTRNGWAFADRTRTTAEIIRDLYTTIREAAGDAYLIGCNTIGHLGAGLFELQRTGDDTSGRHWERTRKMGVNTLAFRQPQHNAFFAADADCVGLTEHIPWDLNRQWLDVLARSGTALFVSAEPAIARQIDQRAALTEAFARAAVPQPLAIPLDWQETTCPRRWKFGDEEISYDWSPFPASSFDCPG